MISFICIRTKKSTSFLFTQKKMLYYDGMPNFHLWYLDLVNGWTLKVKTFAITKENIYFKNIFLSLNEQQLSPIKNKEDLKNRQ